MASALANTVYKCKAKLGSGFFRSILSPARRLATLSAANTLIDLERARTFSPANLSALGAFIVPEFLTQSEHDALVAESMQYLQARKNLADLMSKNADSVPRQAYGSTSGSSSNRYEDGHWDGVIKGYKEVAVPDAALTDTFAAVATRVRSCWPLLPDIGPPKPQVHVLELSERGHIDSHVDSIKFSGGIVAGVCLASDAVMLLQHVEDPEDVVRLFLPQRCLYMLTGPARYVYGHAIPAAGSPQCTFKGRAVHRGRRISLIFRDELPESKGTGPSIIASGSLSEED